MANILKSIDEFFLDFESMDKEMLEGTTGRRVITIRNGGEEEAIKRLKEAGIGRIAHSSDFENGAIDADALEDASMLVLSEIGCILLNEKASEALSGPELQELSDTPFLAIEDEVIHYGSSYAKKMYLKGLSDAVKLISDEFYDDELGEPFHDEGALAGFSERNTWGILATGANKSSFTGSRIKIAVLDTGLAFNHPDFSGREIYYNSFIHRENAYDGNGHGTHCTGTAAGPRRSSNALARYGIAHESVIFTGKVLSNSGGALGNSVLAGMNWAVKHRCEVISMSLGAQGGPYTYFTLAGQRALENGCLIVAAAGNESSRPYYTSPTGNPANSPTIMSVGSLNRHGRVSDFSNRGKIDIAAPGSDVYSSLPPSRYYGLQSGTSMAAPHVAGCAALLAQSNPSFRGRALWSALRANARNMPLPRQDIGSGLVQAP